MIEETEAGAEFVRRFGRFAPVRVAFWAKEGDEDRWYLHIASDGFVPGDLDEAYGEVLRLAEEMASPYLDPFQVKLIPSGDPLAQAALDINQRYPGRMPTRFGGTTFGGVSVEGVYIYPDSATALSP